MGQTVDGLPGAQAQKEAEGGCAAFSVAVDATRSLVLDILSLSLLHVSSFFMLNSLSRLESRCCFFFSTTIKQELRVYVTVQQELKPGKGWGEAVCGVFLFKHRETHGHPTTPFSSSNKSTFGGSSAVSPGLSALGAMGFWTKVTLKGS